MKMCGISDLKALNLTFGWAGSGLTIYHLLISGYISSFYIPQSSRRAISIIISLSLKITDYC
jgi:hypothetical protein